MPVTLTYPGVYIEEIPSGVRTITGVATSVTAFAGWAARGPTASAWRVLSFGEYERIFGGLDARSQMSYAVNHFFQNGGSTAIIVRLTGEGAVAASVTIDSKLKVTASSSGEWANEYAVQTRKRTDDTSRFSLTVLRVEGTNEIPVETFANLSMVSTDPRFVSSVLAERSELVTAEVVGAATAPADTGSPSPKLTGGVDGTVLEPDENTFEDALLPGSESGGLFNLDREDIFNLLCVPGETKATVIASLQKFCRDRRAFLIADSASDDTLTTLEVGPDASMTGSDAINAAFYFPWVQAPDPLQENRPRFFPPSGFVAGIYARTDAQRGVWKAPAGTDASINGASSLQLTLTDNENGVLNPKAVNALRNFPVYGNVIWGARTMQGNDERGSEWKYVPVRRLALFLEESLYRGTKWVVFEPNDEPLWAQIRLNLGAFMQDLFRQGAFQGKTPREAYFVKCDKETTTQNDVDKGIVNIVVGFAPLKPAEFVVIKIQQIAGQIQV